MAMTNEAFFAGCWWPRFYRPANKFLGACRHSQPRWAHSLNAYNYSILFYTDAWLLLISIFACASMVLFSELFTVCGRKTAVSLTAPTRAPRGEDVFGALRPLQSFLEHILWTALCPSYIEVQACANVLCILHELYDSLVGVLIEIK